MKATINENGNLTLHASCDQDVYTLKHWLEDFGNKKVTLGIDLESYKNVNKPDIDAAGFETDDIEEDFDDEHGDR